MTGFVCAAAALVATGYGLGRWRPCRRACHWAWWQAYCMDCGHRTWRWWPVQAVFVVELGVVLISHPYATVRALAHRKDGEHARGVRGMLVRVLSGDG